MLWWCVTGRPAAPNPSHGARMFLDEAEIERSIREINEAIQRSSQKRK